VPRFVLIATYVAWPATVALLRLVTPVRRRCLAVLAGGWLAATVLATTATPATRAVPLGLAVGAGLALGIWPAISRGVTFTFAPDRRYWAYDGKIPVGDRVALAITAGAGLVGVLGLL
jgi:hypothetical protein